MPQLPFDAAWAAVVLCGIPIILEAVIGLVTAFDIKADVLVSIALIASLIIGEDFAAGEVACSMQLGARLEDLTVARARACIEKLVHLTPQKMCIRDRDPGTYRLPGNVSSQFFTGLLFVMPLLEGDSTLVSTTPLESRDYLEMTRQAQAAAGVTSRWLDENTLFVPGGQTYQSFEATAEADWSQAGFWYAADFLDSRVDIRGLNPDSAQGDKAVSELYWRLARPGDTEIDVSGCPDLLPPLAVMARCV